MSSRLRAPERGPAQDPRERPPARRGRSAPPGRGARRVAAPVLVGGVLLALLVGYLAGSSGGGTATVTETRTVTEEAAAAAPGAAGGVARADVALAVLNGSGESGLAGRTADEARDLGYEDVTAGNAPGREVSDRVLHREGAEAEAAGVAEDLGLPEPVRIPADDPLSEAAGAESDVIVVLGPSGAAAAPGAEGDGAGAPAG